MKIEDYNKYYIQGSDHYLIPKDEFKELFNEMINWKEESQKLQTTANNCKRLKDNWDKLREFILEEGFEINTREYGSLDVIDKNVILEKMQELEGSDSNEFMD
jgi:hypothetical protein